MTTEEAFVKVLQMHGIEHAFGIIGSAFMPISDLFPKAGITFWDVAHETNGGLICDGYTRSTGKMAMASPRTVRASRASSRPSRPPTGTTRPCCW
jgi:sulfoacetaldehyde acetyltransferase